MDYLCLFLHADVAGCVNMPIQVHLCCHTSAGTLYECACVDACLDMPLQMQLCRIASANAPVWTCICGCSHVDMPLQGSYVDMPVLVHLKCLCK